MTHIGQSRGWIGNRGAIRGLMSLVRIGREDYTAHDTGRPSKTTAPT
jgi:hypothetical protein